MEEEIQFYLDEAKEAMENAVEHTQHELSKIRAGRAMPTMLDDVRVEYYGSPTPVNQVATVNTPDARTIMVKPFEKNMLPVIEGAIRNSDLGVNPQSDGEVIRISLPALTEERRRDLIKQAKNEIENGKISVRNARKDANNSLTKLKKDGVSEDSVKRGEDQIQAMTDKFTTKIDDLLVAKEKDIMTV
jgi:ribosome recycling factor